MELAAAAQALDQLGGRIRVRRQPEFHLCLLDRGAGARADLAVDVAYQRQGIGKRLIDETRQAAGESATLILDAAPAAQAYYPKIGMTPIASGRMIPRTR